MQLSRIQFFFLLNGLIVFPFFAYKLIWLSGSAATIGEMCFMGKQQNGQIVTNYPVIKFTGTGPGTIFFNGIDELQLKQGDAVPVRYQKNNPADARINTFTGIWLDTVIYAMIPFLFLLITFLHRGIVPRKSKIIVGIRPVIKVVPLAKASLNGHST
jgi:hypothetical protein